MAYSVTEMFCALQGEGHRAGRRNVFVRFSGCNLKCSADVEGFDCDTDFRSVYKKYKTADELVAEIEEVWGKPSKDKAVILTGGEPTLQMDLALVKALSRAEFFVAIETNGINGLPDEVMGYVDWVSCSPKTAEHTLKINRVDELRYVRAIRQGIPRPKLKSTFKFLSPAADGGGPKQPNLEHCLQLIDENPEWRLSVQMHKLWSIR
jgi:7-carboxy-7-deazaguanine synthase